MDLVPKNIGLSVNFSEVQNQIKPVTPEISDIASMRGCLPLMYWLHFELQLSGY